MLTRDNPYLPMTSFHAILNANQGELIKLLTVHQNMEIELPDRMMNLVKNLRLREEQIVCAVGFNPHSRNLDEINPLLGLNSYDELIHRRNDIFTTDIYKRLSLDNVLHIYTVVKDAPDTLQIMQYLLKLRLDRVEARIEETVNSLIIEKYKAEMRAIYSDGVANIDFTEERLNRQDSGFRALLNEVAIIVESRIIPAGDIFFRDTILPEEKRKMLSTGLIPRELVESRLKDKTTSIEEKKVLNEYLKFNRP